MKRLLNVLFVMVLLISNTPVYASERTGDMKYLNQEYWLPEEVCINFHYENGEFDGFEVAFKVGKTDLFRNWRVGMYPFPFILEMKLIAQDQGEIEALADEINKSRGQYWDFGTDNKCIDQPRAYFDSNLADFSADKFGIGIINPHYLEEGRWYKFFIKMRKSDNVWPVPFTVSLQIRLNIDVWKSRNLDYNPGDDFEIGYGWYTAWDMLYTSIEPSEQAIANYFSFALEHYKGDQEEKLKLFSNYFVDIQITGGSCKSRP